MSERVTWETCPNCQRLAAVGWLDGMPMEFDCPNGCSITRSRMTSAFRFPPSQELFPPEERATG